MKSMNFGEPSGGGFIDTHFDFKQCQRPDGTIYGSRGDCVMKGSKEVSNDWNVVGNFKNVRKIEELLKTGDREKVVKLFTTLNSKGAEMLTPATGNKGLNEALKANFSLEDQGYIYGAILNHVNSIRKGEGKEEINLRKLANTMAKSDAFTKGFLEGAKKTEKQAAKDGDLDESRTNKPKPAPKPKAEPKRVVKITQPNVSKSEMLSEWRNIFQYERKERGEPPANARRNATFKLLNEGYDVRKLEGTLNLGVDLNNIDFK